MLLLALLTSTSVTTLRFQTILYTDDQCKNDDPNFDEQVFYAGASERNYVCNKICFSLGPAEICNYHRTWCARTNGKSSIVTLKCGSDSSCSNCDSDSTSSQINTCLAAPIGTDFYNYNGFCTAEVVELVFATIAGVLVFVALPLLLLGIFLFCRCRSPARRRVKQSTGTRTGTTSPLLWKQSTDTTTGSVLGNSEVPSISITPSILEVR